MTFITFLLAFVPGFTWLFFYLQEDTHPEPKPLIFLIFLMGGFMAIIALGFEYVIQTFSTNAGITNYALLLLPLAFVEEAAKFLGAWIMARRNPDFKEPVDAMIYIIVISLGFATLENIGSVVARPGTIYSLSQVLATLSFRLTGATLLHTLTSGIVGYYWAIALREFKATHFVLFGVIAATSLHALFNYFILTFGYEDLSIPLIFLIILGLIVLGDFERLKVRKI